MSRRYWFDCVFVLGGGVEKRLSIEFGRVVLGFCFVTFLGE